MVGLVIIIIANVERQHCNCYLQWSIKAFKCILKAPMTYFYSRNCLHWKGFKQTLILPFRQTSAGDDSLKAFSFVLSCWATEVSFEYEIAIAQMSKDFYVLTNRKRETPEMENPKGNAKYIKMSSSVQKANGIWILTRVQQPLSLLIFLFRFLLVLHRFVRLDKCQSLTPICQVFCVHSGKVDGHVQQRVGDHLFDDARWIDARLLVLCLLELGERCDDDVSDCGDGSTNHAPFEWQWKHRVWHEESEQNVPDEIFSLSEADSVANKTCTNDKWVVDS